MEIFSFSPRIIGKMALKQVNRRGKKSRYRNRKQQQTYSLNPTIYAETLPLPHKDREWLYIEIETKPKNQLTMVNS